jgi:hypothetical protein
LSHTIAFATVELPCFTIINSIYNWFNSFSLVWSVVFISTSIARMWCCKSCTSYCATMVLLSNSYFSIPFLSCNNLIHDISIMVCFIFLL